MTTTERKDEDIKADVLSELEFEPSVKETDIGVLVHERTVTLDGYVPSYAEKWDAVRATRRVAGVRAIADNIEVRLSNSPARLDGDIASALVNQISSMTHIPEDNIKVTVRHGRVTLEGEVEWRYQKIAVERAAQNVVGVTSLFNLITIKAKLVSTNIKRAIEQSFERSAIVDADAIQVEAFGSTVILRGEVRTYPERLEAERTAWAASGVLSVENDLAVKGRCGVEQRISSK